MAKSMSLNLASGLQGMLKDGHKHIEGVDAAVVKNIDAVKELAAISRTSLGPNGMNKLVINHLEKIFVTSDTAAVMKELEVVHPAARLVVMAAKMQEQEVGDGTNFVVTFAGELLSQAESLLRTGLHTSEIVAGYEKAYKKAVEILEDIVCYELKDPRKREDLIFAIKAVLAAKQYGYEDILAPFVADACLTVMPRAPKAARVNVDNVRVCKIRGGNIADSQVVKGMVVLRDSEGTIKKVEKAKVVVFGCGIEQATTETKGTVLIHNADELLNYNKGEEKLMEDAIRGIAESGAKVVVAGGTVSEMALHFIEKFKLMCVKVTSKWELRRICRAVGATALVRLGPPTPEETGHCDTVFVREMGGRKITIFSQEDEDTAISTILLRASTENVLNDLERAIDDGVNCVKALCKDARFLPGAGAVEIELARLIQKYGESMPGLDQYAIKKFAESLEVVPRTLAENSGQVATDVISGLYAAHAAGDSKVGIEIEGNGGVKDKATKDGVLDLYLTKLSALRLATDTALTVLRVDQIIMAKMAGGPKPQQGPADDD